MNPLVIMIVAIPILGSAIPVTASEKSFFVEMGSGIGVILGPSGKMCQPVLGELPTRISIGYTFSDFSVSIESTTGWQFSDESMSAISSPGSAFGSLVGSYSFLNEEWIRAYFLVGIGAGFGVLFCNSEDPNDTRNDVSGPVQLNSGFGLNFRLLSWLELSTETRLRIGIPDNIDVVTLSQYFGCVFRF